MKHSIKTVSKENGIALLLTVVIISIVMLIAVLISNIVVAQLKLAGDINDSTAAIYAADSGVEWQLYQIRHGGAMGSAEWDSYTKLLLHFDGTDGSTSFTDEIGKSVTTNGNAQISTAQSKFGGASGYFDGSGDYLSVSSSSDWNIDTGDFTVDFWYRANSPTNEPEFFNMAPAYNSEYYNTRIKITRDYSVIRAWINGINPYVNSAVFDAAWHHVALVRYSGNVNLFIDGVGIIAISNSPSITNDNLYIGVGNHPESHVPTTEYWKGYIDEFRFSPGIARWTADFTPPTSAYSPDIPTDNGIEDSVAPPNMSNGATISTTVIGDYPNFTIKSLGAYKEVKRQFEVSF